MAAFFLAGIESFKNSRIDRDLLSSHATGL
jgi:hypothetical protein